MTDMPTNGPNIEDIIEPSINGSQKLINQVRSALDKAYDISVSDIDDMINRLGNLKETLKTKKVASQDKMKDFLATIGESLATLSDLDKKIKNIEENHL